jgi:hypothetical protein
VRKLLSAYKGSPERGFVSDDAINCTLEQTFYGVVRLHCFVYVQVCVVSTGIEYRTSHADAPLTSKYLRVGDKIVLAQAVC